MNKYNCSFIGRQVGAIGIRYAITEVIEADTMKQAEIKLYNDYEHISQFIAIPVK